VEARISAFGEDVYQITLTPPLEGFGEFISAWLVTGRPAFLVDVGPGSTAQELIRAVESLGAARLDYILLTHIHLDHAGAVGRVSGRFPAARIVCHPEAVPHLLDPSRLWHGSRKVLGEVALGYGPVDPVPRERLVSADGFAADGIRAVMTPGHASHHVSYAAPGCLFAGEACGVHYTLGGGMDYMRPATPPVFLMATALASIERLVALNPSRMALGHHGMMPDGAGLLRRHREQLLFWEERIGARLEGFRGEDPAESCLQGLLAEDPRLENFPRLTPSAQRRERYFLKNSIIGFLGWLSSNPRTPKHPNTQIPKHPNT
jgi:glyoxylase-like metal-dependent hydrolase (beta-lactamase superfamily II)